MERVRKQVRSAKSRLLEKIAKTDLLGHVAKHRAEEDTDYSDIHVPRLAYLTIAAGLAVMTAIAGYTAYFFLAEHFTFK